VAGEHPGEDGADVAAEQGEADGAEERDEVGVEQQRERAGVDGQQRHDRECAEHERQDATYASTTLLTARHAPRIGRTDARYELVSDGCRTKRCSGASCRTAGWC
jgi:hypothetical protein